MEYILNTAPLIKKVNKNEYFAIKEKILKNEYVSVKEQKTFLDFYVAQIRESLETQLEIDIYTDPLSYKCDLLQALMGHSLEKAGVVCYPQETQNTIHREAPGHSFLVAFFNNFEDKYLIDLSYRQFFIKENCDIERLMVIDGCIVRPPDPGFFVMQNEDLANMASTILEHGYIYLDEQTAKYYGDSFYFAKTGRDGYSDIPGKAYLNSFLHENHRYSMNTEDLEQKGFNI